MESLASTAAEGRLLAGQAADGRLRGVFTRVHARELGETSTHEAEKLADASASAATASAKRDAVRLAQDISGALSQLQVAPGDPAVARRAAQQLRDAADRASALAKTV